MNVAPVHSVASESSSLNRRLYFLSAQSRPRVPESRPHLAPGVDHGLARRQPRIRQQFPREALPIDTCSRPEGLVQCRRVAGPAREVRRVERGEIAVVSRERPVAPHRRVPLVIDARAIVDDHAIAVAADERGVDVVPARLARDVRAGTGDLPVPTTRRRWRTCRGRRSGSPASAPMAGSTSTRENAYPSRSPARMVSMAAA